MVESKKAMPKEPRGGASSYFYCSPPHQHVSSYGRYIYGCNGGLEGGYGSSKAPYSDRSVHADGNAYHGRHHQHDSSHVENSFHDGRGMSRYSQYFCDEEDALSAGLGNVVIGGRPVVGRSCSNGSSSTDDGGNRNLDDFPPLDNSHLLLHHRRAGLIF